MFRNLTSLALISILAFVAIGHKAPAWSDRTNQHFIQNVPFTRQLPNFCGPASLSSLLAFWGVSATQTEIGSRSFAQSDSGTNGADMLLFCRDQGLSAYSFNGTIKDLKEFVSRNIPVMILQDMTRTWTDGHFRIVVGYNDDKGTVTLRDSRQPGLVTLAYKEFDYLWDQRGRWAMLVVPGRLDTFKKTMGEDNPVLYMDLAQAYLHRGQFQRAEQEIMKALDIQPDNTYARDILSKVRAHRA